MIVSSLVLIISITFGMFILIKGANKLNDVLSWNNIKIELFSIRLIIVLTLSDLVLKLIFTQLKVYNLYPYLRLKIEREKLADFLILNNHLQIWNIVNFIFFVPVIIICSHRIHWFSIIIILLSLSVIFICNNYISMICNIMRIKFHFIYILLLLSFCFVLVSALLIENQIRISLNSQQVIFSIFIFMMLTLSIFSHMILKRGMVGILYLN
jgi:hypothetical protein